MKNLFVMISLSVAIMLGSACKKEKSTTPTPTPTTATTTIAIALVDYAPNPIVVTSPKVNAVLVSPAGVLGDTISLNTIMHWSTAAAYPANDSTAFALYGSGSAIAGSISYPLANDGSYFMLYFYEGSTVMETVRVYPTDIVAGAGPGSVAGVHAANVHVRYSPELIVLGW